MKIPYGYYYNDQGVITIDKEKAKVIQMIFDMYITGLSLRTISQKLSECNILTPTGKQKWSAETIDKMISNKKFIPIISFKRFVEACFEKERRH